MADSKQSISFKQEEVDRYKEFLDVTRYNVPTQLPFLVSTTTKSGRRAIILGIGTFMDGDGIDFKPMFEMIPIEANNTYVPIQSIITEGNNVNTIIDDEIEYLINEKQLN